MAALSVGLVACSSTYVLTRSASSTLATLDRQKALAIVARDIPATRGQNGFVSDEYVDGIRHYSDGLIDRHSVVLVGTQLRYTGYLQQSDGISNVTTSNFYHGSGTVNVTVRFRHIPVRRSADFTKLLHVWVRPGKDPTTLVTLVVVRHGTLNYWLNFDIAAANLDDFLAAIKYLSPAADIEHHV